MDKTQESLKISILGRSYSIITDEDHGDVHDAVRLVDGMIKSKFTNDSSSNNVEKISVIVALQLAIDLAKKQRMLKKYESEISHVDSLLNEEF